MRQTLEYTANFSDSLRTGSRRGAHSNRHSFSTKNHARCCRFPCSSLLSRPSIRGVSRTHFSVLVSYTNSKQTFPQKFNGYVRTGVAPVRGGGVLFLALSVILPIYSLIGGNKVTYEPSCTICRVYPHWIIMVTAMIGMLTVATVPLSQRYLARGKMDAVVREFISSTRHAQTLAQTETDGEAWGVYVGSSLITVFQGDSFCASVSGLRPVHSPIPRA